MYTDTNFRSGTTGRHPHLDRHKVGFRADIGTDDKTDFLAIEISIKLVQDPRLNRLLLVLEHGIEADAHTRLINRVGVSNRGEAGVNTGYGLG